MATVLIRYWAAAKAAAGVAEERCEAHSLKDALDGARSRHGPELGKVLDRCSFLLDGLRCAPGDKAPLHDGSVVEVLPPFAGG